MEVDVALMTPWFLTLFAGPNGLNTSTLLRVWDAMFFEGIKITFRLVLVIFRRAALTPQDDIEQILTKVKRVVAVAIDHNELLKEAFALKSFGRRMISDLRTKHRNELNLF